MVEREIVGSKRASDSDRGGGAEQVGESVLRGELRGEMWESKV